MNPLCRLHLVFSWLLVKVALTASAALPSIDYQPQSQTVILYQQAAFGVIASLDASRPLFYQWRKDGLPIAAATNDQIVLAHAQFSDAGLYSVIVTNAEGSVTSSNARLTVNPLKGGDMDFSFAVGSSVNDVVFSLALQPDGKAIIAGGFNSVSGAVRFGIARLNADGTTDHTFLDGPPGAGKTVYSVAVQSDGKVLIGGNFTTVNGGTRNSIARLNRDGSLDNGFQNGLIGADGYVYSVALQSDGKVLIGGSFTNVNGVNRRGIARLNSDGTMDTGFQGAITYSFPPTIYSIGVQSDGKVLIGGFFTTRDGSNRTNSNIARLNANGTLDSGFQDGTNRLSGADGIVRGVAVQSDGKVLIGGNFSFVNRWYYHRGVARLNVDGTLDSSFQSDVAGSVRSFAVQSDGKIVIGGQFTLVNNVSRYNIARFNPDGTLDNDFQNGLSGARGGLSAGTIFSVAVQIDGKVHIAGAFSSVNGAGRNQAARLNADGTLDGGFRNGVSETDGIIYSVAAQRDGKVLIGGGFSLVEGVSRSGIARLNADGTLDTGFQDGMAGVGGGGAVLSIAVQNDGKVLAGGTFTTVNGVRRNRIARLNADGSLDNSFLNGLAGAEGIDFAGYAVVFSIAVQSDGKVLIGGNFDAVNGVSRSRIARLNADGTLDSFQNGLSGIYGADAFGTEVYSVAGQEDGRVLVGGYFTAANGVSRTNIARLNADGTLDTGFQNGLSGIDGRVYSVAVQNDGKVLIGGLFTMVNGASRVGIARLNVDGTLDNGFPQGILGVFPGLQSIALQKDGKAVIGGGITITANGAGRTNIARLNADGTLDNSFQDGLAGAIGNWVLSVALQGDGKVLIGGSFDMVNGVPAPTFARLWGSADIPPLMKSINQSAGMVNLVWDGIPNRTYRVQYTEDLSANSWTDLVGDAFATGGTASKTDPTLNGAAQRFYRVVLLP